MATLFFTPHQDDELLAMGTDIINHINDGHDVKVILCTDGVSSKVRRLLSKQGSCTWHSGIHNYGINEAEFIALRDEEFKASCRALGVREDNIHIYHSRGVDGSLTIAKAREIFLYYMNMFPNSRVKTYTPCGPSAEHTDHKTLGKAALELYNEGRIWNNDLRFYIEPWLIDQWKEANPGKWSGPVRTPDEYKIDNALAAYKIWSPGSVPSVGKTGEVINVASNDVLNIRKGPGTTYSIAFTMKNKEEVEVIGASGKWLQVKCLEKNTNLHKIGWCNGHYIKRFPGCNHTSKFGIGYHSAASGMDPFKATKTNYYHRPE